MKLSELICRVKKIVLFGSTVGLLFLGSGCFEGDPPASRWIPVQSARPFFPMDLGGIPEQAVSDLSCSSWQRRQMTSTASELFCPAYQHGALQEITQSDDFGQSDTGTLKLRFEESHLVWGIWERNGPWNLDLLRQCAEYLDAKIRERHKTPFFFNFFPSEWAEAIDRGEVHERWHLGLSILALWVGKRDGDLQKESDHSLAIEIWKPR